MTGEARANAIEHLRAFLAAREYDRAEAACHEMLAAAPDDADVLNLLGVVVMSRGDRLAEAIEIFTRAAALAPATPEHHNNLGEALRRAGRAADAVASFERAVALRPDYPQALNNLALALHALGRVDDAIAAAQRATRAAPDYAKAYRTLAAALRARRRIDEAAAALARAADLEPRAADVPRVLGDLLVELNQPDAAEQAYRRSIQIKPHDAGVAFDLASTLDVQGNANDSIAWFERSYRLEPRDRTTLLAATRLPVVYESVDEIHRWRDRLRGSIDRLTREGFGLDVTNVPAPPLFFLPYQGLHDHDLLRDYARLIAPPPLAAPLPRQRPDDGGRIRVGFISRGFKEHTIGRINRGLIAQLDREQFEVVVLAIGPGDDAAGRFVREHADVFIEIPRALPEARRLIADAALDVLVYTDIGMDGFTYSLAFSRLAPVQAVTWGHPATSGVPALDYYVSSALLESADADAHYTEKLVRLPNLSVYYYKPRIERPLSKRDFGYDDGVRLYGCLQSLFKLHPEFDGVLDDILRRDPAGVVIIPHGTSRHWDDTLMRRLARTMPGTVDRVRFFEPMPYARYLAFSAACDVLLAPIHFGAGNTTYESLAFGTPTVTLPSELLKGRITYGLYRAMGVTDCVATSAAHYAELAARLGMDPEFNRAVRAKILLSNHVLYENPAGVRDLEAFFREAVARLS